MKKMGFSFMRLPFQGDEVDTELGRQTADRYPRERYTITTLASWALRFAASQEELALTAQEAKLIQK